MMYLRRVALSFTLISVFAISTFAGETGSPPAPCVPGETGSPPCSAQSVIGSSPDPGDMNTPPANEVDLTTVVEVVQLALSLF